MPGPNPANARPPRHEIARFAALAAAAAAIAGPAGALAEAPADGQWPMSAGDYANTRYSPLDQIRADNVGGLKEDWTFSTGVQRGHEAAPLVVGGVMFLTTPYPNTVFALDLAKGGALKWRYDPSPSPAAQGVACCDVVSRGAAHDAGVVFFNTLDCRTIALDAATGRELWAAKTGDINKGETVTMAPLVVRGKVLVGNSGGEYGVRGWILALDARDGHEAWRAFNTGPDADCRIGPRFKPFYDMDKGADLGVKSWPAEHWRLGGGNVWGFISYDPALNLIFHGTGNPGSWNPELRPGDNKWSAGLFARDPDTGEAVWFYQFSPHDLYDHDAINENILVDLRIGGGEARPVVVHPERNGYIYVMDRNTGEVLSATPYVRNTVTTGVDLKSGRLQYDPKMKPENGKVVRDVQPASPGAKDWQPAAWSPRTGLLYIPHQNLACDYEAVEVGYIEGTPYVGVNEKMYAGKDDPESMGYFTAWDPVAAKIVWRDKERFPCWSGALATAGDVVFYGTMDGWFKALDAHDGRELWRSKVESGIIGQPIAFLGPDGRERVAILSGIGGWAGAIVSGDIDARDPTAATGMANAMRKLPEVTQKGGRLYVYVLP